MTPDTLAMIHLAAFTIERPWSATEFADLLSTPFITILPHRHGFAMTRTVAGESELLTIAVYPSYRRQGIARALMLEWLNNVTAEEAFLEVAADNLAACALYSKLGFAQVARRTAYYARKDTAAADAIVMRLALPQGPQAFSSASSSESG